MTHLSTPRLAAIAVALWLVAVSVLGYSGVFEAVAGPAGIAPLVFLSMLGSATAVLAIRPLRERLAGADIFWLTAFHVWRIPAAMLFFWYGDQGLLPARFVDRAGWGDLVSGALALVAIVVATRAAYWAAHLVGFADFLLAVGTGVSMTLLGVPAMATLATFPVVLIPLFGVAFSFAVHLAAFSVLLRRGTGGLRAARA